MKKSIETHDTEENIKRCLNCVKPDCSFPCPFGLITEKKASKKKYNREFNFYLIQQIENFGLDFDEVCIRAGFKPKSVRAWYYRKDLNPTVKTLIKFCRILDCSIDDLIEINYDYVEDENG